MNKQTTTQGSRRSPRLWALALVAGSALLLGGCSSKPELKDKPEELAKLPQWTQVALVLESPLSLFGYAAILWAVNGAALITKTIVSKKKDDDDE